MNWKGLLYPLLPSWSAGLHTKRRKGLFYRWFPREALLCQTEQDRIFWEEFLHPDWGGVFWEIGAGDGVVGSHTLGLEMGHGWRGTIWEPGNIPRQRAAGVRKCRVEGVPGEWKSQEKPDLLAIHRAEEFRELMKELAAGRLRPGWVVVANAAPDPGWTRRLEAVGYRLRLFIHDDEYYGLEEK